MDNADVAAKPGPASERMQRSRLDPADRRVAELLEIMQAHQQATEQLQQLHDTLQAEVSRLRAELERKNRLALLGEMAAGLAHEIRNPLGGIQLYASLLERELAGEPAKLQMVRKIAAGVHYLNTIVSDMLTFARLPQPDRRRTDVAALLNETIDLAGPRLQEAGVAVRLRCTSPLEAWIDPSMLQRAVLNLLINAAESMPQGGRLDVAAAWVDLYQKDIRIVVHDSGPGLDPSLAGRLFEPFFTTKHHGTGLGLALTQRIVEAHGGRITASNHPAGGAMFEIVLPHNAEDRTAELGHVA